MMKRLNPLVLVVLVISAFLILPVAAGDQNVLPVQGSIAPLNVTIMDKNISAVQGSITPLNVTITDKNNSTVQGSTTPPKVAATGTNISAINGSAIPVQVGATGLTISDGLKITSSSGDTSTIITVSGSDIPSGGSITINVSSLHAYVASTAFTDANVQVWSNAVAAGWWGVMDADGINLTLMSAGGNTTSGESVFVTFTGASNPWVTDSGGNKTLPLTVTRTDTGETATINFMIETISGLKVMNGETIVSPYGTTSPVITVSGSDIPAGGIITIDLFYAKGLFASWTPTDANFAVSSNATAATWTAAVAGDSLILTSTGGPTLVGQAINVTFNGTAVNPWAVNTAGPITYPLAVTRSDGYDPVSFSISIDMIPPVSNGLNIANGAPITTTTGATSPVITITNQPIAQDSNITIFVPFLPSTIASYSFNDANVVISDTAANATWTRTVTGDRVILTSTGGPTAVGENVTVTFTGAANPWVVSLPVGMEYPYVTAVRGDELGSGYFTIAISTQDPTDLIIEGGAKINATSESTSPVITITGADIVPNGTISIDLTTLNNYVASGTLTNANVIVSDTAANATWTRNVSNSFGNTFLTLKSTGGRTVAGENITLTFTGSVNPWTANTNGEKTESIFVYRDDGAGSGFVNFVIETTPPPEFVVAANFTASPTSEMVPLTVTFMDSSQGNPTSWNWDFGDGSNSTLQNPVHTYTNIGFYTVTLTAANSFGPDTKTRWDYIAVVDGAIRKANATIEGLTVTNCNGPQTITVDTSILPATLLADGYVLEIQPPVDRGLKNITIYAQNGIGFGIIGNKIIGKPTSVHLETEEIAPSSGFSNYIGTNASFDYSIDSSSYPCGLLLTTKILEGVTAEHDFKFRWTAANNSAYPIGTAYTANMTRTSLPPDASVRVIMSINPGWNPSLLGGPGQVFIWGITEDGNAGQILPTQYLYNGTVNNLDYYVADPPSALSTFGLSSLTGTNNPFQIIAFVATQVISDSNNPAPAAAAGGGGGGPNTPQVVAPSVTSAPVQIKSEGTSIETAPMEAAPTPEPTILISSKSSMQTDVEMYGWLFGMIAQNPVTLVILGAAIAMVAYFGWWKRRL
jgi:PKD repeat protein